MTFPGPSPTPHERGVAHLLKYEYAEAAAAFTEAIRLDPDAPNSYLGRALGRRRIGDEAGALEDERTARELGGPERSAWDKLANRANRRWRGQLGDPAWRATDPLSRQAVLLRALNAQILNGGLCQWIANGYGAWVLDVAEAAEEVGTPAAWEVAALLGDVARALEAGYMEDFAEDDGTSDDDDEAMKVIGRSEDRYFAVQVQFVKDVSAWLEVKVAPRS
jgi:hypothetical protein